MLQSTNIWFSSAGVTLFTNLEFLLKVYTKATTTQLRFSSAGVKLFTNLEFLLKVYTKANWTQLIYVPAMCNPTDDRWHPVQTLCSLGTQ